MATFFLCLTGGSAALMVIQRDPAGAIALALNTAVWTLCARVAS